MGGFSSRWKNHEILGMPSTSLLHHLEAKQRNAGHIDTANPGGHDIVK